MRRQTLVSVLLVLAAVIWLRPASAYDIGTHRRLGQQAGESSLLLDAALRNQGFQNGVATRFLGQTPIDWIQDGAGFEDVPFLRVVHHFHNPLRPWANAGLNVLGIQFQSSVLWGQSAEQDSPPSDLTSGGGTWSWPFARQQYLQALTEKEPLTREEAFAKTFRALGQLTHLVQDATVPAHVRNDPHPSLPIFQRSVGNPDPYEDWVEDNSPQPSAPVRPDQSVFRPTGESAAPVPVAGLIDTRTFLGANPDLLSSTAIGVAEYTNGNFLSKDRMFLPDFPFPRASSLDLAFPIIEPEAGRFRRYFRKQDGGESIEHFVAEGLLYRSIVAAQGTPLPRAFTLDRRVHRDYAQLLLPRAVGYSAALLDHFFRGQLSAFGNSDSVAFFNFSQEAMNGTVTLYYDDSTGKRTPVPGASWTLTLGPQGFVSDGFRFVPPSTPPPKDPEKYVLVFHGARGDEQEAVVARQVVLSSVVTVRLTGRLDGRPDQGFKVQTIEVESQRLLGSGQTDPDGKATLRWKPGGTVLLITNQNTPAGPMYWAGGSTFSSSSEGAKILEPSDVDAHGVLNVAVPRIIVSWPERVDTCTGNPVFKLGNGFITFGLPLEGGHETVLSHWETKRATFTRNDTGQEVILFDNFTLLAAIEPALVPEDLGRIGTVVGYLTRDVFSGHQRIQVDAGGTTTSYVCFNEYHEVEVLPVTIVEFNPFQ